jgi:adenosylhomocysteine nucleosidase
VVYGEWVCAEAAEVGMIAVIAALPREVKILTALAKPDENLKRQGIWLWRCHGGVVVAAGMGAERATLAVQAAIQAGNVSTLISAGLAGSCSPDWIAGKTTVVGTVVDAMTGERFRCDGYGHKVLATASEIASIAEKRRLLDTYGAYLVDMEAATVARLAQAHGLKFRAIKGVSDDYDFELSGLSKFTGRRGQFRTAAFALHTALRPWTWSKAVALGRNSALALNKLQKKLEIAMERDS